MDFRESLKVLAARPADAHADCEHVKHTEAEQVEQQPGNEAGTELHDEEDEVSALLNAEAPALELIRSVLRLQEKRVLIYAEFERGFEVHKKTPEFQAFSTGITSRFAAVSEQINCVEQALKTDKNLPAVANLIRKLQEEEKEKLLLTSAVLIEKMRLADATNEREPDNSTVPFLERSLATLRAKHQECISRINDVLDEVRIEMTELDDE